MVGNKMKFRALKKENICLNSRGWRVKVAKIVNITPQYSKKFIDKYGPELWEMHRGS